MPFWNPYLFEGAFQLPALYPADLLHALWPTPAFVSWLLSLHLPLAALGAYALARELGCSRAAAFVPGAVLGLCGFSLSTLNLYVFLQALALAPFVALLLRRAALHGGRAVAGAAVLVALATATLAVEFVAQAAFGAALGLAAAAGGRCRALALAIGLGAALAALPVAVTLGLLPETTRGAGLPQEVALANSVHPLVLLQSLLPHLFGDPAAPAEAWWGGRFFSKGLPYFLSLYLGPNVLALAAVGAGACRPRLRLALLAPAALGLWYSLGRLGGLAPLVQQLPLSSAFRFPSKALLLLHLAVAVLAGFGIDALCRRAHARAFAAIAAGCAAAALGIAALTEQAPASVVAWSGVLPTFWPTVSRVAWGMPGPARRWRQRRCCWCCAARRRFLSDRRSSRCWAAGGRRSRAGGRGVEPAGGRLLLRPAAADRPGDPGRGRRARVLLRRRQQPGFSRGPRARWPQLTPGGFYPDRQVLGPYTNVLDCRGGAGGRISPPSRRGGPSWGPSSTIRAGPPSSCRGCATRGVARRESRPARSPGLAELGTTPGVPGVTVRVYGVAGALPRAYVACRVLGSERHAGAGAGPTARLRPADRRGLPAPWWRIAPAAPSDGSQRWRDVTFDVNADGSGVLVVRESCARLAGERGRPARAGEAGERKAPRDPDSAGPHRVDLGTRRRGSGGPRGRRARSRGSPRSRAAGAARDAALARRAAALPPVPGGDRFRDGWRPLHRLRSSRSATASCTCSEAAAGLRGTIPISSRRSRRWKTATSGSSGAAR